jgi:glycosyltransferase involved in cell wall biosynthesis
MRFCVDAHAIGRRLTGNEVYIRSLLEAFATLDRESEFIAYISTDEAARIVPASFEKRRVSRNPFLRLGCEMSRRLREDKPDLIHVQYTAPLNCPPPIVVSVHDVSFLEHPEYFTPARALQLRLTVRNTVRRAARILTGSEFSRAAIARAYSLDSEQIAVVPNAAASLFRPAPRAAAADWVRSRLGLSAPFILTVGDLQARKNQAGLIRAFAEMVRAHPEAPHHLVLAGQDSWHGAEVHAAAERSGVGGRIHLTGFVSDPDLLQLYNACEFFVFPSFYEGFGLPVLEAMACGRAVACSNASAVHEVADAAALLFDPYSIREMTQALIALATDAGLRARMERAGIERAAQFSWRRTAEQTLAIYYEVARAPRAAASVANS